MIVLKDKKDIRHCPASFLEDYEWESHGQYDSLDFVNPDVKVLSVQFTKVGEKTYKAFPNLEWIVVRQHGYDNINLKECERRNIGVVTTKPFAQPTADWINQYIKDDDKIALIGNGSVGSKVKSDNIRIVGRNIDGFYWHNYNTLIVTVPPEKTKHLINNDILSKFKGKLISVSRSDVIDNKALLDNIDNISHAYIDTLGDEYRKELLDTGKVTYTKHIAWEHSFSYENNITYFEDLEQQIKDCLNGLISKPILNRSERVMF